MNSHRAKEQEEGRPPPLLLGRPSSIGPGAKLKVKTKKELSYVFPEENKLETYDRKPNVAFFDRIDLLLSFVPGKDNIGAIFRTFINAIKIHDNIIKNIEENQTSVDSLKKDFSKKNRLFQNYVNAWNVILPNAVEYEEFKKLHLAMASYDSEMSRATELKNEGRQFQLIEKKRKYLEMYPRSQSTLQLEEAINVARVERDEASALLKRNEGVLQMLLGDERVAAKQISDDHIYADEKSSSFTALFPNVHVGFILASLNNFNLENMPFLDIQRHCKETKPPHLATFRRYDYRFDPFTLSWLSLQEYRDIDIFVDDPLLSRSAFVATAATGTVDRVRICLLSGDDPNSTDATGCTAMHFAAGKGDIEMVDLLLAGGATIDPRDIYMVTPLLLCIRSGQAAMAKHLLAKGASVLASDRNGRGGLFEAVTVGSKELVALLLNKGNYNTADSLWGFTPLHIAASLGNIPMLRQLLAYDCSIFRTCNNGFTAEIVARNALHIPAQKLLEEERLTAPAQLVYTEAATEIVVWIGDLSALDPVWSAEVGISHVVCLCDPSDIPRAPILSGTVPIILTPIRDDEDEDDEDEEGNELAVFKNGKKDGSSKNCSRSNRRSSSNNNSMSNSNNNSNNNSKRISHSDKNSSIVKVKGLEAAAKESPHIVCCLENDDDDTSNDPWLALSQYLPLLMTHLLPILKKGSTTILICDMSGDCLSPAVLMAALLLHKQIRTKETLASCLMMRPSVRLSASVHRGVEELQLTLDAKKMDRLNAKLRHSEILSINF